MYLRVLREYPLCKPNLTSPNSIRVHSKNDSFRSQGAQQSLLKEALLLLRFARRTRAWVNFLQLGQRQPHCLMAPPNLRSNHSPEVAAPSSHVRRQSSRYSDEKCIVIPGATFLWAIWSPWIPTFRTYRLLDLRHAIQLWVLSYSKQPEARLPLEHSFIAQGNPAHYPLSFRGRYRATQFQLCRNPITGRGWNLSKFDDIYGRELNGKRHCSYAS